MCGAGLRTADVMRPRASRRREGEAASRATILGTPPGHLKFTWSIWSLVASHRRPTRSRQGVSALAGRREKRQLTDTAVTIYYITTAGLMGPQSLISHTSVGEILPLQTRAALRYSLLSTTLFFPRGGEVVSIVSLAQRRGWRTQELRRVHRIRWRTDASHPSRLIGRR